MEDRAAQDQRLVGAVLAGATEAFEELVTHYQRLVGSIAWRYGVRREEIEDVVSEVFMKTFQNLHRYRPDFPFSTWLYRLAANHVMDHGRRARREAGRSEMPEQVEDTRPDPAAGVETGERAALVRDALGETPERYREVLFLVYIEGLQVEETARTLGIPVGTVKSRLKRGRDALRKTLVRKYPGHFGDRDALQ